MSDDSNYMIQAKAMLADAKGIKRSVEERREASVELAALMLNESRRRMTHQEQVSQGELARMMDDLKGKAFVTAMTDECFRAKNAWRIADQLIFLLRKFGVPRYLSWGKQIGMHTFKYFGHLFPQVFVPALIWMIRKETNRVILPGERRILAQHIKRRTKEGVRINLNHLGEAILGEEEAEKRLAVYLEDLARPEVEYISVKISSIFSQINLIAWEESLSVVAERLRRLYQEAGRHTFIRPNGMRVPKFVNLDMEEYRDLHLTCDLFKRVLNEPQYFRTTAGIVLQSYLPDSFLMQKELTIWAQKRVADGGAPIKIRLVKGANLSMEQVEASIRSWPQAPYRTKSEVDANFKRMLLWALDPEHAKAARIGVGSHNLFDIAYALLLRAENGVERDVTFEMLEGMTDQTRRTVQELAGDMLLYCPAAAKKEFVHAVSYLVRRLDENTAPENFLRHQFNLIPGTREWHNQANLFSLSCHASSNLSLSPRRGQNRFLEVDEVDPAKPFRNESDTDWSLPQNRKWIESILQQWSAKDTLEQVPLVIGGKTLAGKEERSGKDPSRPDKELYRYNLADSSQVDLALRCAEKGKQKWAQTPVSQRSLLLAKAAHNFRAKRGAMLGAIIADGGKTPYEADIEYSEAIDFIEYYRKQAEELEELEDLTISPKGIVVIAPPWNFPSSIPTGGISAALASGNMVIFKPARETAYIAYQLAQMFWDAGISKEVLQFIVCEGATVGSELIGDPRVSLVVLTGATETAKKMFKIRPGLDLMAETGGKNSLIVTEMADRDIAVRDIVQSAFSHSGQKCSACSLAILVAQVYDDPVFMEHLRDAAASLKVGSAWDLATRVNPLIHEPNETLLRGLTTLEEGESWLLEPKQDPENPNLWSPGIRIGVKEGSFTYANELFGPVLSVMRADNLEHAIALANGTPYGLTAGLQSLDDRQMEIWQEKIVAGNLYINRSITGAVVQRQPFGGCKQSSFGTGAKAGGPNYVWQMIIAEQKGLPVENESLPSALQVMASQISSEDRDLWQASVGSFSWWWKNYYSKEHDPSKLLGQDNILRYVPHSKIHFRMQAGDRPLDLFRLIAASAICRTPLEVSGNPDVLEDLMRADWIKLFAHLSVIPEMEAQVIARIERGEVARIRLLSRPSDLLKNALADAAVNVHLVPVLANGRFELFHWLREVASSYDYHRWGNLGLRENEERASIE